MPDKTSIADGLASAYGYETFAPCSEVQDAVECYWIDRHADANRPIERRIVPDGCAHLVFHEDDIGPHLRYVGPRSTYIDIDQRKRTFTLIARFHPGAAMPVTDRGVRLEQLWGRSGRMLCDRLAATDDAATRVMVLDDALRRRPMTSPSEDVVRDAVASLQRGATSVTRLAAELGLSARHLRDRFGLRVGFAPKTLARIVRLHRAIGLAAASETSSWASIAARVGFSDQPHLVHEFRALLGDTPTRLMRRL